MVGLESTKQVAKVTGADSINRTDTRFGIHATDLGILWAGGDGRLRVLFGDTYGAGWCGDGAGPEHADWRSNVLAYAGSGSLEEGLRLEEAVTREDGRAAQVLPSVPGELTVIPNSGIALGDRDFVHYMSIRQWGEPGTWQTNHAGIAVSADGARTWIRPDTAVWPNTAAFDQKFQIGAFAYAAGYVYLFGTSNGRFSDAFLARVPEAEILDTGAYEYRTANGWSGQDTAAVGVIPGPIGELSVGYNDFLGAWVALHLDEHRAAIVLRTAPELDGPWSAGTVLVSGADYPALYGGYLHPGSLGGPELHYLISQWRPYNVFHLCSRLTRSA
ncbi:DUF4185 domain-containing protein [Sciscionella sediminilitoris]|uniref:DUF4185 domain-containing protein n=1 Tax=Sciscionella sediminilitoris TaxID=1445613 RepID=UPI0004DF3C3D|nr:DUF4185 domain-containing protein [Sciscionella sp. SE31]